MRNLLAALLVAGGVPLAAATGFTGKPVVAGYWPAYAADRLPAANIAYSLFTHIDWFVATTTRGYSVELSGTTADIKTVVSKGKAANVTVSMTVGGWDGGLYFSDLVSNATGRAAFATSLVNMMNQYGFAGIDIDWEYPAVQGIGCNTLRANDTANLLAFVQELRAQAPAARLSAAVSVNPLIDANGNVSGDIPALGSVLDYITVMAYDIYGPTWSSTTGPVGALYDNCATPEGATSGSTAVQAWISAGFPAKKILLGLPAYAYPYTTTSSTLTTRTVGGRSSLAYQNKTTTNPTGGVTSTGPMVDVCGNTDAAAGVWLFQELISSGKLTMGGTAGAGGYTRIFDTCSQTPFLFNNATRNFIAYDDGQSFSAKAAYARAQGLAGTNMFDMTGDTKDGLLTRAVRQQLLGTSPLPSASFALPAPSVSAVASSSASSLRATNPLFQIRSLWASWRTEL